jgi:CRP-like cAMP-binding protein
VSTYRNQLLSLLRPSDLALLEPHFEPVALEVHAQLESPGEPISHVYFPEDGIVSVVASMPPHREIEVGIIGSDGIVGGSVLLADGLAAHRVFVQIEGTALKLPVTALLDAAEKSSTLRAVLGRYLRAFGIQVSGTALANGHATLEARLARWLLMCADRLDGRTVALTHEYLSLMIGVRRSGVTLALQILEGEGAIRPARGSITILDRGLLEARTQGCYGQPEAEYRRLLGPLRAVEALV